MSPTEALAEALREGVRGRVTASAAEVEPYSTDFSGVRRSVLRAVVVRVYEQDVVPALRVARSFGLRIAIRGAGHSANGRTVSDGGILLVQRADHADHAIQADGRVEVSARTPWHLLAEPRVVPREQGIEVPAGMEVRVVENTGTVTHLVLPPKPAEGELSEAQLERAAGGATDFSTCL